MCLCFCWGTGVWDFFEKFAFFLNTFLCLMIQLNSGKVIAMGPGIRDRDGKLILVAVKGGDTVLFPEYGGTEVKLGDKE